MTYDDEYDEDLYEIEDERAVQDTRRAVDRGVNGSIIVIIILTLLYVLSPIDFVPDFIPVAGQADDLAALVAGGGSVAFLTVARYGLRIVMRSRVGRWGCFIVITLIALGAIVVFWALLRLLDAIF